MTQIGISSVVITVALLLAAYGYLWHALIMTGCFVAGFVVGELALLHMLGL